MLQLIPMLLAILVAAGIGTFIEWCRAAIAYVRVRGLRLTRRAEPEETETDDE